MSCEEINKGILQDPLRKVFSSSLSSSVKSIELSENTSLTTYSGVLGTAMMVVVLLMVLG